MDSVVSLAASGAGIGGGATIAFLFIKWVVEHFGGRMDKRADRLDAGTATLISQLQGQVAALLEREKMREERLSNVEGELAECKRRHADADAELMRLKAIQQGRGEMRDRAQVIVSAEAFEARRKPEKKG